MKRNPVAKALRTPKFKKKVIKDKGISIFITDHNVKETLDIVDRAYIINNGELIAEGSPQEIIENKKARQLYLGSQFRI